MRFSVDTNVLVYAVAAGEGTKHDIAGEVMTRAPLADCVLPAQVLAEFLNVIVRRFPQMLPQTMDQAQRWAEAIEILPTEAGAVMAAASFAPAHKLQFCDALICKVARAAGAEVLLSEDVPDGLNLKGLKVVNPFLANNRPVVDALLQPIDG